MRFARFLAREGIESPLVRPRKTRLADEGFHRRDFF
jgi:hypothetical protein